MSTIGFIANPASGKDLRRLVASGTVVGNREKINTLERALLALDALGLERALIMPDPSHIAERVIERVASRLQNTVVEAVELPVLLGTARDTERAVAAMAEAGCSCLVVMGGDGTSRVVAKHCGSIPLVPISTGTNNVFPQMVEGTLVGMAVGALVSGAVQHEEVCEHAPKLELVVDGEVADIALIDLAVIDGIDTAARAVWQGDAIRHVFLTRAQPVHIGLSAIGGYLGVPLMPHEGLHVHLDPMASKRVKAPIAPGLVADLGVKDHGVMRVGQALELQRLPALIAVDGERETIVPAGKRVHVRLSSDGPLVVNLHSALNLAAERGFYCRAD